MKQLALANESQKGGVVVILAERDKEEMELDIARFESDMRGTIVICRSGSPLVMADLKKVRSYCSAPLADISLSFQTEDHICLALPWLPSSSQPSVSMTPTLDIDGVS